MKRIVYIIPGYGEKHTSRKAYGQIEEWFNERGIKVIHVNMDWHEHKPRRFSNWVAQFLKQYKKRKGDKTYVFGFSYGATIAFLSEPKARPDELILCSLSPYFVEDLKKFKPAWLKWWRKNFIESDYSFNELAPKIKAETTIFVGAKEGTAWGNSPRRAKEAKRLIKDSSLQIIPKAKHNIGQKEYLAAINKFISTI